MRSLNRDEIMSIKTGDNFSVKLTKLYYPNPVVEFEGVAEFYVQRSSGCATPVIFALRDHADWAEYSRFDLYDTEYGLVFINEEYQMEIFDNENRNN